MLCPAGSALRQTLSRAQSPGQRAAFASLLSRRPKGAACIHSGAASPGRRMSTVVEDRAIQNAHVPPPPPRPQGSVTDSVAAERPTSDILKQAVKATGVRNDWTKQEIAAIYNHPLMDLAFQAASPREPRPRAWHDTDKLTWTFFCTRELFIAGSTTRPRCSCAP